MDVTVVRMKTEFPWFKTNYSIFAELGFRIVNNRPQEIQNICKNLNDQTLVIGGGYFGGDIPSLSPVRTAGIEEIDVLYRISKYNYEHQCGAKCLRYHNGDTGFGSQEMVNLYDDRIRYVDFLMFDNDLLRDFVLYNSQEARKKKSLLGYLETPLKCYVIHNMSKIERRILSMGRNYSQFNFTKRNFLKLPVTFYPLPPQTNGVRALIERIVHKKNSQPCAYDVAGKQEHLSHILRDRKAFMQKEGACAFGLSHMYDIFYDSIDRFRNHKDYYWSLEGQFAANGAACAKEQYYAFSNNASKDLSYMMFGIIPLISHVEHSYYKTLVDKKMAILIKRKEDLREVLSLSDAEIQEYRDNIWNNRELFTFDHLAKLICEL